MLCIHSQNGEGVMADKVRKLGMKEVQDYRLENDPRFRSRIEKARANLRAGRGIPLEDIEP
jgi:hypothetical protein